MPAINFQTQFAALIMAGKKTQTVRKARVDGKERCKAGDEVQLFVDARTKNMREFARVTIVDACPVVMRFGVARAVMIGNGPWESAHFKLEQFARADGFGDWSELEAWFTKTHGVSPARVWAFELIRWDPKSVVVQPAVYVDKAAANGDHSAEVTVSTRGGKMRVESIKTKKPAKRKARA